MSPAERLLWHRIQRRVREASPELRAALLRAFRALAGRLPEAEIARLLRSGSVERLVSDLLNDAVLDDALRETRQVFRRSVESATTSFIRDLPRTARGIGFDLLNPDILQAVQALETRVIQGLKDEVRETVRQFAAAALEQGQAPTAFARRLRDVLGLAPNQEAAVRNFERMLRTGDREALRRALRDRRFDRTIRNAFAGKGLTEAQIRNMTNAYRRKMVAFNADTHARTIMLDAQKLGQRLSWQRAISEGFVDGNRLMKRWSGVLDDRERDSHLVMEGETVGWDEPFSNGQMLPGDGEFNCRCVPVYFTASDPLNARRPGAGARGLTAEQLRGIGRRAA